MVSLYLIELIVFYDSLNAQLSTKCGHCLLLRGAAYSLKRTWDSAIADYTAVISISSVTDEKADALEGRAVAYASKSNDIVQEYQQQSGNEKYYFTAEEIDLPIDQLTKQASSDSRGDWIRTTTELMKLQLAAKEDTQKALKLNPRNQTMQRLLQELSE